MLVFFKTYPPGGACCGCALHRARHPTPLGLVGKQKPDSDTARSHWPLALAQLQVAGQAGQAARVPLDALPGVSQEVRPPRRLAGWATARANPNPTHTGACLGLLRGAIACSKFRWAKTSIAVDVDRVASKWTSIMCKVLVRYLIFICLLQFIDHLSAWRGSRLGRCSQGKVYPRGCKV